MRIRQAPVTTTPHCLPTFIGSERFGPLGSSRDILEFYSDRDVLEFARGRDLASKAKPPARTSGSSGFLKRTKAARSPVVPDMVLNGQVLKEEPLV